MFYLEISSLLENASSSWYKTGFFVDLRSIQLKDVERPENPTRNDVNKT